MRLTEFDFHLPEELIAQTPLVTRSASRLLDCSGPGLVDRLVVDLPALLGRGDLLVFNDTKVIKARLHGTKATGGKVEMLVERITGSHTVTAQLRVSHAPPLGSWIHFGEHSRAEIVARDDSFYQLRFSDPVSEALERDGEVPLPPYIKHQPDAIDSDRYQTVFARFEGAVAAPTAGLHFDQALLDALQAKEVQCASLTLHVGAGTFQPVRSLDLAEHRMHSERYSISETLIQQILATRRRGGRIVAVGTTSVRALESAMLSGEMHAGEGETRLFITPGFEFRLVDAMITNFHLPKSTLMVLVSAFAGVEKIRRAYAHAIARQYRFFSYGDAMLLTRP